MEPGRGIAKEEAESMNGGEDVIGKAGGLTVPCEAATDAVIALLKGNERAEFGGIEKADEEEAANDESACALPTPNSTESLCRRAGLIRAAVASAAEVASDSGVCLNAPNVN
jgi:hypothetical protein